MSEEPMVEAGERYLAPGCPSCGYRCGCCCFCECQTTCPQPDENGDCPHTACHGGHEPWDCRGWRTRYEWAKSKLPGYNAIVSAALDGEG